MRDPAAFAVFILTNGRPDKVDTVEYLKRCGYTGRVYLIIDNEDPTGDEYRARFGAENVIEFDKAAVGETFDTGDTTGDRRSDVYARNASFGIARDLGLDYFLQLDDDYDAFGYRLIKGDELGWTPIRSFDAVNDAMIRLLEDTGAVAVAMAQGGDAIGGINGNTRKGILRKAMNSLYLRTDRPLEFVGRLNNDVNTYIVNGAKGDLFLTVMALQLHQPQTQQTAGGMSDAYAAAGTYVKSFYTVMMAPSCVRVGIMGPVYRRFHHAIKWDHAVPKIVSQKYRKTHMKPTKTKGAS